MPTSSWSISAASWARGASGTCGRTYVRGDAGRAPERVAQLSERTYSRPAAHTTEKLWCTCRAWLARAPSRWQLKCYSTNVCTYITTDISHQIDARYTLHSNE